jgi:hypothetical protein
MFIAVLFTTAKRETTQTSSMDEWISERSSIHTMECYSAIKRNEKFTHYTIRLNLEFPNLWERSHVIRFHVYEISKTSKSTETKSKVEAFRGRQKEGMGSSCLASVGFLFG